MHSRSLGAECPLLRAVADILLRMHHLETLALHAGHDPHNDPQLSRAVPLYQTTSYCFQSGQHAADLFALKAFGNIYTRLMNPTQGALEARLAALHQAKGALCVASGMSAIFYTVATLCSCGDNLVAGTRLYGGTVTLFQHQLKRFGITVKWIDTSKPEQLAAAIDAKTRLVFTESIGNPDGNCDDLDQLAHIAHAHGVPLVVDNTLVPPPIFNPFAHGADVLVYSLTKLIGGHGTSLGGAILERGDFPWNNGRFPTVDGPDPSYHGVDFWAAFGGHPQAVAPGMALVLKIRCGLLRDTGAAISPFNAWQIIQGVETLPLRARTHCAHARVVADFLAQHAQVAWVRYAGHDSHPDAQRALKLMPLGPGAVFGFGLKGGRASGEQLVSRVKLCSHLANVLDARTLVIHPASTTHQQLSASEQAAAGVRPEMVRISVGLEDPSDICADLDQALTGS